MLSGCAATHDQHQHTDLDSSVAATRAAIAKVQRHTASIRSRDPATTAVVSDLNKQLADLGVQFDSTAAKISWYESDWARLNADNTSVKSQNVALKTSLHRAAKQRDFYPFLLALAGGWVALRNLTPTLSATVKVIPYVGIYLALASPSIAFSIGAAACFILARLLADYGSRLLP